MSRYNLQVDLSKNLKSVGLNEGDNCYVPSNVSLLAKSKIKKDILLSNCLSSFQEVIGSNGTIFSPSASMNLCNTNIPFDKKNTPSNNMGAFAEFIRKSKNSIRSLHPFWSISGIGKNSNILSKVSRHSYGLGSPWSKFLDLDVRQINIGIHPSKAVTLIHHVEVSVGVPYRYTKEFLHPIVQSNGEITIEPFYMSVMYKESDIKKKIALNEHYFLEMKKKKLIQCSTHSSGLSMWSFKMRDFYKLAKDFFIDDIYNYLENPPKIRPFSQ